jgi:hypothetical protein
MDFGDSREEAAFRDEVRAFLATELPEGLSRRGQSGAIFGGGSGRFAREDYWKVLGGWISKLADKGWVAPPGRWSTAAAG